MATHSSGVDQYQRIQIQGVSSVNDSSPLNVQINPLTQGVLVDSLDTSGLDLGNYDYVSMALSAGDTTETYTFKTGGSGGSTAGTTGKKLSDLNTGLTLGQFIALK